LSALPRTIEKMDARKDSDTAVESSCTMDVVSPVQSVDVSEDVDGNMDDATQLKSSEKCISATETVACHNPTITESCQSIPSSADVEMQSCEGEYAQRMEIGSEENTDTVCGEEDGCMLQKGANEVNEEDTIACQSAAENDSGVCKSTEDTEDTEAERTAETDANGAELTDNNEQLVIESNAAADDASSLTTTPTSGTCINSILASLVTAYFWSLHVWLNGKTLV